MPSTLYPLAQNECLVVAYVGSVCRSDSQFGGTLCETCSSLMFSSVSHCSIVASVCLLSSLVSMESVKKKSCRSASHCHKDGVMVAFDLHGCCPYCRAAGAYDMWNCYIRLAAPKRTRSDWKQVATVVR